MKTKVLEEFRQIWKTNLPSPLNRQRIVIENFIEKSLTKYGTKHTEEVLVDLLPEEENDRLDYSADYRYGHNNCRQQMIKGAKEKYNIII